MGEEMMLHEADNWGTPEEEARSAVGNAVLGVTFEAYGGSEGYAAAYTENSAEVKQNLAAFAARFPDPTAVPPESMPPFVGTDAVRDIFETATALYEVAVSKGLSPTQLGVYAQEQAEAEGRQITPAEWLALSRYEDAWVREHNEPEAA